MSIPPHILVLVTICLASPTAAKFEAVYPGIATEGLAACTANMTREEYTARSSCRAVFKCVMGALDNSQQAILSSGASILGFIPTVMTLLGCTSDELLRVHAAGYPLFALLLSVTNISTISRWDQPGLRAYATTVIAPQTSEAQLGAFSYALQPYARRVRPKPRSTSLAFVYLPVALAAAAGFIWQTYDVGTKGLLTWACWTSHYPGIWLILSVLQHVLGMVFMRLSLRHAEPDGPVVTAAPTARASRPERPSSWSARVRTMGKDRREKVVVAVRSMAVWDRNLSRPDLSLEIRHPRVARYGKVLIELLTNANFVYGTAVFSSLTMVSGVSAVKVLTVYALVSATTRLLAAYVVEG